MRIVFAGTPDFAVPSLRAVVAAGHEVPLVLSQPDRPKGRGLKVEWTPVHQAAVDLRLTCQAPARIVEASKAIRAAAPDVIVTAAFGQKVPDKVLALAKLGGLNVHASLLPRHRGAAPVAYAILSGDAKSGVTIFRMVKEMDAGPVLAGAELDIGASETTGELEPRIAALGAATLVAALNLLGSGQARFAEQDHARATLAPKLTREDGAIDWSRPAVEIARRIRAMNPWPMAAAALARPDGTRVRVLLLTGQPVEGTFAGEPGDVLDARKDALRVRAGSGAVDLTRLQPENRKPVTAGEFANGLRMKEGGKWRFERAT